MPDKKTFGEMIIKDVNGIPIYAKTQGQYELVKAIEENEIIFVNGPAGVGKTLISCAMAAKYIQENKFDKIVISRPLTSCGADVGWLPGSLSDKTFFHFKPLYDVLKIFFSSEASRNKEQIPNKSKVGKRKNKKVDINNNNNNCNGESDNSSSFKYLDKVEASPLAFLRGTTFDNTILLQDEAQNIEFMQMKMLLTRIGHNSKFIINGDINQCDLRLHNNEKNGLDDAMCRLKDIKGIAIINLTEEDIVRNGIIREILKRYEFTHLGKS